MSVNHIIDAKQRKEKGLTFINNEAKMKCETLFDHIVNSELPDSELSVDRLASEAQVIMGAGTVTTARTMDFLAVRILLDDSICQRLREELREPMKDFPERIPPYAELEKLPWLQACIKEALRLSPGLTHRLPRVSPHEELIYKDWVIPRNVSGREQPSSCEIMKGIWLIIQQTPVGMSAWFMHMDPLVYKDPTSYRPERWLEDVTPEMHRNYVPFTKGSRRCLGVE